MLDFSRSIIEEVRLFPALLSRPVLLKRDDLIHPLCNGNKARKFAALLSESPCPQPHFSESTLEARPDSECSNIWVSYGGIQSNAMAALAYLSRMKGVRFCYVAPSLDSEALSQILSCAHATQSNLAYALEQGMELIPLPQGSPVSALKSHALSLAQNLGARLIPQGGCVEWARLGMRALAQELGRQVPPKSVIFYTSGSGVGVVALQEALREFMPSSRLVCVACAGKRGELEASFSARKLPIPPILYAPFAFAKPRLELWAMRAYLAYQGVRVDLIYDSAGFYTIWAALKGEAMGLGRLKWRGLREQILNNGFVFIHSGGLSGDVSQEARYRQRFGERLLDSEERIAAFDF